MVDNSLHPVGVLKPTSLVGEVDLWMGALVPEQTTMVPPLESC